MTIDFQQTAPIQSATVQSIISYGTVPAMGSTGGDGLGGPVIQTTEICGNGSPRVIAIRGHSNCKDD